MPSMALIVFSWWQRALMNGCGITTNRVATLRVAVMAIQANTDVDFEFTHKGLGWFLMSALLVVTTIQVQDLRDQESPRRLGDLDERGGGSERRSADPDHVDQRQER